MIVAHLRPWPSSSWTTWSPSRSLRRPLRAPGRRGPLFTLPEAAAVGAPWTIRKGEEFWGHHSFAGEHPPWRGADPLPPEPGCRRGEGCGAGWRRRIRAGDRGAEEQAGGGDPDRVLDQRWSHRAAAAPGGGVVAGGGPGGRAQIRTSFSQALGGLASPGRIWRW